MKHEATNDGSPGELRAALQKLEAEILDGLEHGFFELSVVGEQVDGGKSTLTIRAGKSHRYTFPRRRRR